MKWSIKYQGDDFWHIHRPDGRYYGWTLGSAKCALNLVAWAISKND
jgi:hypothetical protein